MATIQWRPEVNALTVPQSYRVRYLPRNVVGYDEVAEEVAKEHPNYNEELIRTVLEAGNRKIQESLINGDQVNLENAFIYRLSFTARLDSPDDSLPDMDDLLQVKVHASRNFVAEVRHAAELERSGLSEKLPLIASAEDTRLRLNDVLYAQGVLKLTGTNLYFDEEHDGGDCVIEGTRSGKVVQVQYAMISNSVILVVPDIPEQTDPWNNEYTVSVSTHYTEHGTLRTGTFQRKLRSPLLITGFGSAEGDGILTGGTNNPNVTITDGTAAGDGMVRVQVILNLHEGDLLFNLLDMTEEGEAGEAVRVTANGDYILTGFADSLLTQLNITVNNFNRMVDMIRNDYSGRLVDILDIRVGV